MRRTEHFPITSERTTVTVDVPSGTVEMRAARADAVVVNIDTDRPEEWEVSQLGDLISVRSPRRWGMRTRSVKLYIEVPQGTHLEISTASADVSLVGALGDARVRTASGDLRADTLQSLDAGTASGDIRVGTVLGRLTASTASGDVKATSVGDDLDAGTASGDVRVGRCNGGAINVKAVSGDITLGLPAGVRVEPDISTLSGRTVLPSPPRSAAADEPRRTVRVRLRTVSGDITIERVERR